MSGLTSLRDQLPLLLVLSPLIGFIVTSAAAWWEPKLIRPFAISNMLCTLVIVGGLEWQFESDLATEAEVLRLAQAEVSPSQDTIDSLDDVRRTLDRIRVERRRNQWFVVDGINLFSVFLVAFMAAVAVGQMNVLVDQDRWFLPAVLLFESASVGTLTSDDVRVFLFMLTASSVILSVLISWGRGGTAERRNYAERFLIEQFAGGALITLGFSMLVIAVPWMKMPDSTSIPPISWNLTNLIADIQKWTVRNELAFHYASEVFPWMLFVLTLGFAIQSGFFPFHLAQVRIVGETLPAVAILYLIGTFSVGRIGWMRFVMPIAPDLLAAFDRWMLIPAVVGILWGAINVLSGIPPRQKFAFIVTGVSAVVAMGCYSFTRIGMSGAWLMHQQMVLFTCAGLIAIAPGPFPALNNPRQAPLGFFAVGLTTRTLLLMFCVMMLGVFASGFLIVSELIYQSLLSIALMIVFAGIVIATLVTLLNHRYTEELSRSNPMSRPTKLTASVVTVVALTVVVSLFPGLLLHQVDAEFGRIFRRFEQSKPADSAETPSVEPQQSQ
jgi:NADH:ubiquinone oxidoreductase subunit 4 (subunit M)